MNVAVVPKHLVEVDTIFGGINELRRTGIVHASNIVIEREKTGERSGETQGKWIESRRQT